MRLTIAKLCLPLLCLAGGMSMAQDASAPRFVEGTHYDVLTPRQQTLTDDGTVEVAEIFAYSCPHCMNFEPALAHWLTTKPDNVSFVRIPAAWGDRMSDIHAQAFYTAAELGILEDVHPAFFREFHERRNYLETEGKLREFFSRFGVSFEQFDNTFSSFVVHTKLQRAKDLMRRYGVTETPMIIVNGKYQSRGAQAGDYGTWFAIIDELAAREQAADENP